VALSYEPPANIDDSRVIKYMIKYHKDGDSEWKLMPETSEVWEIVNGLVENTVYEFTVAASYKDGEMGPQSDVVRVKTNSKTTPAGKC